MVERRNLPGTFLGALGFAGLAYSVYLTGENYNSKDIYELVRHGLDSVLFLAGGCTLLSIGLDINSRSRRRENQQQ